ncbi:Hypothetical protein FKW44_002558 [Caligus rogercresseyi]|uniref:Uncharacterized protein n=1 Tax=Caligus rogercresseyi TaxID=217165 RepID=A0A7T8KKD5_CALRO|nr:Hypothetical protein FKW44_002558 [Caligus rogercresseyi]
MLADTEMNYSRNAFGIASLWFEQDQAIQQKVLAVPSKDLTLEKALECAGWRQHRRRPKRP